MIGMHTIMCNAIIWKTTMGKGTVGRRKKTEEGQIA